MGAKVQTAAMRVAPLWILSVGLAAGAWLAACSAQPPTNGGKPLPTQPEPTSPNEIGEPMVPPSSLPPPEGPKCGDKVCAEGTECVEYYGIGGAKVGLLHSCEVRCKTNEQCPASAPTCTTIADGPGRVCR